MLLSVCVYFNNGVIPHRVTMLPLRAIHYLTRPQCQAWETSFQVVGQGETPKTKQTIAVAIGCLPELEGKTQLLKTPYVLDTCNKEIELKLTWKPPLWGLVLILSKGAMWAVKGEKQPTVLPSYEACNTKMFTARHLLTGSCIHKILTIFSKQDQHKDNSN